MGTGRARTRRLATTSTVSSKSGIRSGSIHSSRTTVQFASISSRWFRQSPDFHRLCFVIESFASTAWRRSAGSKCQPASVSWSRRSNRSRGCARCTKVRIFSATISTSARAGSEKVSSPMSLTSKKASRTANTRSSRTLTSSLAMPRSVRDSNDRWMIDPPRVRVVAWRCRTPKLRPTARRSSTMRSSSMRFIWPVVASMSADTLGLPSSPAIRIPPLRATSWMKVDSSAASRPRSVRRTTQASSFRNRAMAAPSRSCRASTKSRSISSSDRLPAIDPPSGGVRSTPTRRQLRPGHRSECLERSRHRESGLLDEIAQPRRRRLAS